MRSICFRISSVLGLAILQIGVAGEVRAAGSVPTPGLVSLVFSDARGSSSLGVDSDALEATLCGHEEAPRAGGSEDCRLVAGDQRDLENLGLEILAATELPSRISIHVRPVDLLLQGGVATSCGDWIWTLDLDPRVTQPTSKIDLLPLPIDSSTGSTRGLLNLAARLTLHSLETSKVVELPWGVTLDLLARYAIQPVRSTADSSLVLFAEWSGERDPETRSECVSERKKCGRWCLAPLIR